MNELDIKLIHSVYKNPEVIQGDSDLRRKLDDVLEFLLGELEIGAIRVAEKIHGVWKVNTWIKEAIQLIFITRDKTLLSGSPMSYIDKLPPRFTKIAELEQLKGTRIIPPACIRSGAFIGSNAVIMPSFINVGAYVGEGTMIDTWATVGSCAQIGNNVHLSGGVGIGGVLEPVQNMPTIIEDNCFIGARSEIVEGVIVEKNSVISMGVYIGQSTKIYHRETDTIIYGSIPEGSVVVPGVLPAANNKYGTYCAIIVKQVDQKTRSKVGINALLREAALAETEKY